MQHTHRFAALLLAGALGAQGTRPVPHFEDFESGAGGYTTTGSPTSWSLGTPNAGFIRRAASGFNAWATGLTGTFNPGEQSYLVSPVLDCSGLGNDPFLEFAHIYQLGFSDASWVEVSINGAPFAKLGAGGDPGSVNWYNDVFNDWWDGDSGSFGVWRTARHLVPGAAGNLIQLRWHLRGGTFPSNDDGVGVDDVRVYEASFGAGQAPSALATMDANAARERLGFPVTVGIPGPYYTAVSAAQDTLDLSFQGTPRRPVVLLGGKLHTGAVQFPVGQLDLAPFQVWAAGYRTGGLNPLFNTNAQGSMSLSLTVPLSLVGEVIAFQGVITGAETFALTNAVQVAFLP